jgi:hypothetical protein
LPGGWLWLWVAYHRLSVTTILVRLGMWWCGRLPGPVVPDYDLPWVAEVSGGWGRSA